MKVCFLGDSHLYALLTGWKPRSDMEATFYSGPRGMMADLRRNGDRLVSTAADLTKYLELSAPGKPEVALGDYDAFCLVGLQWTPSRGLQTYFKHRPYGHMVGRGADLISEAAFLAAVDDRLKTANALHVLSLLRGVGKPVVVMPQPMPSELIVGTPDYAWARLPGGADAIAWIYHNFANRMEGFAIQYGFDFVPQPERTFAANRLTLHDYSVGGIILGRASQRRRKPSTDYGHMNAAYGELVIDTLATHLKDAHGLK